MAGGNGLKKGVINEGKESSREGVANNDDDDRGDGNRLEQEVVNEEAESSIKKEDEDKTSLKMNTIKGRKKLGKRSVPVNVYSDIVHY